MSYESLLKAKQKADAAVEKFEDDLRWELVLAKEAYRGDPTDENRARKAAAVKAIRELRAEVRKHRTSLVGGDAFLSPDQNGG